MPYSYLEKDTYLRMQLPNLGEIKIIALLQIKVEEAENQISYIHKLWGVLYPYIKNCLGAKRDPYDMLLQLPSWYKVDVYPIIIHS